MAFMAFMAWVLTPSIAHAATVVETTSTVPATVNDSIVLLLKNDKIVAVKAVESIEGMAKLNVHHCSVTVMSPSANDVLKAVDVAEKSGVRIASWIHLDDSNASANERKAAMTFGGKRVYAFRMEVRNGPGKSWLRANVLDRVIPLAIASITANIFGGWGSWGNVIGLNSLLSTDNIVKSIQW